MNLNKKKLYKKQGGFYLQEGKRKEGKHEKVILIILYILGIGITGLTFSQFYITSQTQSSFLSYEERLSSAYSLREDLVEAQTAYTEMQVDFVMLDLTVNFENQSGIITEEQANQTIRTARFYLSKALMTLINKILIWDPTYPPNGGFVVREELKWLFLEDHIRVYWLPKFYNEIALVDERYTYWNNTVLEHSRWSYAYTGVILESYPIGWQYEDGVDRSVNWFIMDIYFWVYDDYVEEELLKPKLLLEEQLGLLQIAAFATTIGVLLLGFVVDFGERHTLKYFYIILITFIIFWSSWYTIFPFILTG